VTGFKPASASLKTVTSSDGPTIAISADSPADTVRAFYRNLKEKKIRAAIYLTNLRPAIEGLTDSELKDFQVDFEALAAEIPADVQINGEIISGDTATVTAKVPVDDSGKLDQMELHLRREGDVWVILTVDEAAEQRIKLEGKNYFYALRMDVHQDEAKEMLNRIAKAQMVYAAQKGGTYGTVDQLILEGLLPDDVRSSESTGYVYDVKLSADKRKYTSTATPFAYGKTGKLTYTVELDSKLKPHVTSKDNGK
jgi:hypothetical protein